MPETLLIDDATSTLIREAVSSGDYPNESAVVAAAMQVLTAQQDDLLGYSMEELRRLGDEGKASGPAKPFDRQAILEEVFRRAGVSTPEA